MKNMNKNFGSGSHGVGGKLFAGILVVLLLAFAGRADAGLITVQSTGTIPSGEYEGETVTFHATFSDDLVGISPNDFTVYQDNEGTIEVSGPAGTVSWTGVQIHIGDNFIFTTGKSDFVGITTLDGGSLAHMYVYAPSSLFEGKALENVYNINQISEPTGYDGYIYGLGSGTPKEYSQRTVINSVTVVPEPATLSLLAGGALLLKSRRKKELV